MVRALAVIGGFAFALHVVWENAQAPLFNGYQSFAQHLPMCLYGTLGDVVITLIVYGLVSLFKNDWLWPRTLTSTDLLALAVVGFFIAAGIEYRALTLDRWAYAHSMLILPYLQVGLLPVLQMILLLPATFYLSGIVLYKRRPDET